MDPSKAIHNVAVRVATPMDSNVTLIKDDSKSNQVDQAQYQSMVGSLLYASTAFAVGRVSKFSSAPTTAHLTAVKRIFRYLKCKTVNVDLIGYLLENSFEQCR